MNDTWTCDLCTMENDPGADRCQTCTCPRADENTQESSSSTKRRDELDEKHVDDDLEVLQKNNNIGTRNNYSSNSSNGRSNRSSNSSNSSNSSSSSSSSSSSGSSNGNSSIGDALSTHTVKHNDHSLTEQDKRDPMIRAYIKIFNKDPVVRRGTRPYPWINIYNEEEPTYDFISIEKNLVHPSLVHIEESALSGGCECEGDCSTRRCSCRGEGRNYFYERVGRARLGGQGTKRMKFDNDSVLQECNSQCGCGEKCRNRWVQNFPVNAKLEIFYTGTNRGWGVRTLERLEPHSYVVQYVGEWLPENITKLRPQTYLWDLAKLDARGASMSIDATMFGNVSRFLNHGCVFQCNLKAITVLPSERDLNFPLIGLFVGAYPVAKYKELLFDYDSLEAQYIFCTCEPNCTCDHCKGKKKGNNFFEI